MATARTITTIRTVLMASTALMIGAGTATAQQTTTPAEETGDVVVIVGTQIAGAKPTEALPVTVIGAEEIASIAAASGDDLFRSIPQLGDVSFNTTRTIGSLNDARGDTASINLRALGTGNTLALLNGRRMVNHPGTQAENLVPVVTVNTNSIPVTGIQRIEVLLDGASAIYGADAVAGVVNTVLKKDFEGLTAELTYGGEDGVEATEFSGNVQFGVNSGDGRTNLSVLASYFGRDPIYASDRPSTANSDLRSRLPASWAADATAAAQFNNTSITSAWGIFDRFTAGNITVNGAAVTNAAGQFHLQPSTLTGCAAALPNGICIGSTSTRPAELRYNVNDVTTVQNGVDRYNAFAFLNHEFDGGLELFAEAGVYLADSVGYRESAPMLGAVPVVIPASNYYNPFGPVGSPNRLAGYTGSGLDLVLGSLTGTAAYRPIDAGPRKTEVENLSSRALIGLRGVVADWNWESAILYSQANSEDRENRVSNTLFQQALARNTPDAYNPFNGGCVTDFDAGDCTPSQQAAIDFITVDVFRRNQTSIASWDFKLSRPDAFRIWAGDVGAAVGVEVRRETFKDDRDPRQDGTVNFDDIISTAAITNDLQGNNPSLDTTGERDVQSAYVEFAVPVVSDDMNIPFVQNVDMQIAARYENFDTFGSVTKPKVALSWRPFDFLLFRSAWSEGFRAPNLQQQYETGLQRSNNRTDFIRCEAAQRKDPSVVFTTNCPSVAGSVQSVISNRQGSTALEPEESTNLTYGLVFESTFLPPEWGEISFTADWWRIEQSNVVGIFGDNNHILLDYVLRSAPGCNATPLPASCFNPAVVRSTTIDPDDQILFDGSGIAAPGDILFVEDNYLNLDERAVQGWDFGLYYNLDDTPVGDFSFRINAAFLDKFFQGVSPNGAIINAAAASGQIPAVLTVNGQGNLVRNFGRPEWRYTSSLTWRKDAWGAGWFTSYVGDVQDTGIVLTATSQPWIIEEFQTHNLYVQYELGYDSDSPTRIRVGMRNIFNEEPPLADTNFGYLGDLHNPSGRYLYGSIRKEF
ncbi:MAG: TonB-dependent receptor [Hyphomonadaceae bacterium]|nr:TonB-dependent receptor [Hyphomonadaceae bacterium]